SRVAGRPRGSGGPLSRRARGSSHTPRRPGRRGAPATMHPLPPSAENNRLGLAKWLVDRQSPTTARAIVNRIWQAYFGTGLVATSEDLGTQSEPPTPPELLDWLSVELMNSGWGLKRVAQLLVTNAAC